MENNTAQRVTNTSTGLVTYEQVPQAKDAIAMMVLAPKLPPHLLKLAEVEVSDPEAMLATYQSGPRTPWKSGQVIKVVGAIIWFSGPYHSASKVDEYGEPILEEGFYTVLLKLADRTVETVLAGDKAVKLHFNKILKVSSKNVAEMALAYMQRFGWYDWGTEVEFVCLGDTTSGYSLVPMTARILEETAVAKKS